MASLITPTKTVNQSLLAWQDVATGSIVVGAALDVSTKYAMAAQVRVGRRSGTAFTAGWPQVRLEGSVKSSGNDHWCPLAQWMMVLGSAIANTTLNGAVLAAATSFVVTAATNISIGDILFLSDTSTSNYEIVRVKGVSGTTITPEEAVTNAHANAAIVTDQAEMYFPAMDLTPYSRVRAVCDNGNSGQSISVEVLCTTHDNHSAS